MSNPPIITVTSDTVVKLDVAGVTVHLDPDQAYALAGLLWHHAVRADEAPKPRARFVSGFAVAKRMPL